MGADGGTISTNRKYLRAAKSGAATGNTRREQRERQRAEELTTCALGGAPLSPPVVACRLGYLYNKDAVIRFLLQGKQRCLADPKFGHIRKLKSVVQCVFATAGRRAGSDGDASGGATAVAATGSASASASSSAASAAAMSSAASSAGAGQLAPPVTFPHNVICPVTLKPMNKKNPFAVVWNTGGVYSLKAVREMPEACGACGEVAAACGAADKAAAGAGAKALSSERIVVLAPSDLERQEIRERLRSKGGNKKRKRRNAEVAAAVKAEADRKKKAKSGASAAAGGFKSANALFTQGYGLGVGK